VQKRLKCVGAGNFYNKDTVLGGLSQTRAESDNHVLRGNPYKSSTINVRVTQRLFMLHSSGPLDYRLRPVRTVIK
jgi:hypothetical protein